MANPSLKITVESIYCDAGEINVAVEWGGRRTDSLSCLGTRDGFSVRIFDMNDSADRMARGTGRPSDKTPHDITTSLSVLTSNLVDGFDEEIFE